MVFDINIETLLKEDGILLDINMIIITLIKEDYTIRYIWLAKLYMHTDSWDIYKILFLEVSCDFYFYINIFVD